MNPENLSTGLKTAIIKPGETFVLPAGAVIESLIYDGSIDVTSTCDNLPTPEDYKCYNMIFGTSENQSSSPVLEGQDTTLEYLEISGIKYNANINLFNMPPNDSGNILGSQITTFFTTKPPQQLFKVDHIDKSTTGARVEFIVYFKSIDSIVNTIKLKMSGPGFGNGLYVMPVLADGACS